MYQFSLTNQKRYARIYEIGIYAFGINLLAAVIFQLLSVCDFATYTVAAKGLMICGLMAVTGMLYLSDELQTDKKLRINLYSNILLFYYNIHYLFQRTVSDYKYITQHLYNLLNIPLRYLLKF